MNIALIAHDKMKVEMTSFVQANRSFYSHKSNFIYATKNTGNAILTIGLSNVKLLASGPMGGDAQIASLIVEGKIDAVFFFIDPLCSHVHEVDIYMLIRLCNVHNIPLATNPLSAFHIVSSLSAHQLVRTKESLN
jgi:methylglyoxal synthase